MVRIAIDTLRGAIKAGHCRSDALDQQRVTGVPLAIALQDQIGSRPNYDLQTLHMTLDPSVVGHLE